MIAPVSWASLWNSAFFIHLWQSTVFVVVIWLLTLAVRRNAAQTRYRLWMIASVKFLIPFSLLIAAGQSLHPGFGSAGSQHAFSSAVESIGQPMFATMPFAANTAVAVGSLPAAAAPAHHAVSVLWLLAGGAHVALFAMYAMLLSQQSAPPHITDVEWRHAPAEALLRREPPSLYNPKRVSANPPL